MAFIKVESEDMKIEEAFTVKREDTEEQTEMVFIKEEREEVTIEEDIRVKREDTEEQTVREGNCFENVQCGEMATGMFQPYMFEPESDPEFQDDEPTEPQIPRMLQPVTAWCTCENCAVMPTEKENKCCLEIPEIVRRINQVPDTLTCITHHPGFEPVCLNVYSLQNALNVYKADYGPLRLRGIEKRYRHLAHRSFVSWCWGYLSRTIRVDIPSCVVLRVCREFPDAAGSCSGFRPPLD
ncbi:P2X purinoceptor 7-like isoform X2 [Cyprinus carpio]|uniref:P2X purinoceptor 7-like isoform X2 n=1 Tax=Cyprinus carpio TaxID=7962 RepID=A0A9Q9XY11_CYPCA|nr:P2X purinoceptor 7-like isoform X2 [Cyprinus carpio]